MQKENLSLLKVLRFVNVKNTGEKLSCDPVFFFCEETHEEARATNCVRYRDEEREPDKVEITTTTESEILGIEIDASHSRAEHKIISKNS